MEQQAMSAVVKCALASGSSLTVDCPPRVTYHGKVGLEPGWGSSGGACGASCQKWISACVIAHSNFNGVTTSINLNGGRAALDTGSTDSQYRIREGAYWGNVFNDNGSQIVNGCYTDAKNRLDRVCGNVVVYNWLCDKFTSPWANPVRRCGDHCTLRTRGTGTRHDDYYDDCGAPHGEVVTVFRR